MNRWKEKITKFFNNRYGVDDLGKTIAVGSLILYIVGVMIQQPGVALLAMVGFLTFAARAMSGDHWSRNEENLKYQSFLKLWKLRYEYRKTARIFMCEKCGKFIRVPKGKGKIQLTCPRCGTRMIRRS